MNGTGPEGKGPGTGHGRGRCKKNPDEKELSGQGRGLVNRRKSGGDQGKGKRFQSSLQE
jgi:hypothetical protein